jgi:hypothetical protein
MSSGNLMEEILTKWSCLTYNRTLVISDRKKNSTLFYLFSGISN